MKKLVLVGIMVLMAVLLGIEIKFSPLMATLDLALVWVALILNKEFVISQLRWLVGDEK